jgi:hypothetical protein
MRVGGLAQVEKKEEETNSMNIGDFAFKLLE